MKNSQQPCAGGSPDSTTSSWTCILIYQLASFNFAVIIGDISLLLMSTTSVELFNSHATSILVSMVCLESAAVWETKLRLHWVYTLCLQFYVVSNRARGQAVGFELKRILLSTNDPGQSVLAQRLGGMLETVG